MPKFDYKLKDVLPCPFCGVEPKVEIDRSSQRSTARMIFTIECESANCEIWPRINVYWRASENIPAEEIRKAQAAWNKRKGKK